MSTLNPNIILQRIPEVRLRLDSTGGAQIQIGSNTINCGSYCLAILDAFTAPTSLSAAVEKISIQTTGSVAWIDLTSTIVSLYKAGVLREPGPYAPELMANPAPFDKTSIQAAMLNDRARTSSYLAGISEVVRDGDVVVDVGTGTGVLAIAAAKAGAKHVYAIEAGNIGKLAQDNFKANGLTNRITLVEGWSTRIDLPEPADVLVSEIIGNEPLSENVLEVTADACMRLLKPNARLVPNRLRVFALPVEIPTDDLAGRAFSAESSHNWSSWYGFDFSPIAMIAATKYQSFSVKPEKARDWNALSDPILLADINLHTITALTIDVSVPANASASGQINGVLEYFELELGPSVRLSTHPMQADHDSCWHNLVWVLPKPLELSAGQRFSVSYKYRKGEERSQIVVIGSDGDG